MTRREWIAQAEEYERKSHEAYENDDEVSCDVYDRLAQVSRFASCYATEDEE